MAAPAKPAPAKPRPRRKVARGGAGGPLLGAGRRVRRPRERRQARVASCASAATTSYVKADGEAGAKRYRVRVGPVHARARAEELAAKLAKGEKLPTWVLDESKG